MEGASRTALLVAAERARATKRAAGSVPWAGLVDDPWAEALAGDEGQRLADRAEATNPLLELWIAVRTWWLDGRVRAACAAGARQVVLLGAGLDTRAARLGLPDGTRVYEVDHPATQSDKRARLARLRADGGGYDETRALYVACDLAREDFVAALGAAGFDARATAVVIWEGVTYYLDEPTVRATARRVADALAPSSTLLLDHVGKRLIEGRTRQPEGGATLALVEDLGEPMRFGADDLLPLLYEEGFRHVESVTFDEACLDATGTWDRARMFRFQHLVAASVARRA